MKFGICLDLLSSMRDGTLDEKFEQMSTSGYSYVETNAVSCSKMTNDETDKIIKSLTRNQISCLRACILFPDHIKTVGAEADLKIISAYIEKLMPKLSALGTDVVVFGSGNARRIPDGYNYDTAFNQLCDCALLVAEIGKEYGVSVALEHLNPNATNLLTTIAETVRAVKAINHPSCGFLFDFFHVDLATNDIDSVPECKDKLIHSHFAVPGTRMYPSMRDKNVLRPYFTILKKASYDGTVSLEAGLNPNLSFKDNISGAMETMKTLLLE